MTIVSCFLSAGDEVGVCEGVLYQVFVVAVLFVFVFPVGKGRHGGESKDGGERVGKVDF